MKTVKNLILGIFLVAFTFASNAQKNVVKTVSLEQTNGEFTQKSLTLSPGDYIFEIANNGIDHEVGFVLTPKGKTDQAHHIKNAYVTSTVKKNSKSNSKKVTLKKGKYIYFCPLNPTPQYTLVVK
jgi:plastocyanin